MTHAGLARCLLASLCAAQGAGTLAIDLNHTHATNPLWLKHARFHLVWQAISYALLSLVEVALVVTPGPFQGQRFYLAAGLGAIPMLSCLVAYLLRGVYDGALYDPNGILPLRLVIFAKQLYVDLNLTAEVAGLTMLGAILTLYKH